MERSDSWFANIWIGGNYDDAVRTCREYCMEYRLCVTVSKTAFVYVGGMEDGVCARVMQYPRFPEPTEDLKHKAIDLAEMLRSRLRQKSYSIECPDTTIWDSREPSR